jgi:protease IV
MKFLRNLLASILGTLFAFGILFFMFMIFLALANLDETNTVKPNSVLELQLAQPISEYTGNDPADPFAGLFEQSMGLDEVLHAIKAAKEDDEIRGISINGNFIDAGISQIRAIRNALIDFKTSGKFVYAYGDFYMQKDYYLASAADSVYLNPVGVVDFRGLSAEVLFFNELQEKSGVRMEVVRHGKYKSAVEPFLSNEMSPSNREQIQELITSIWETIASDISQTRGIPTADLNQIADTLGGRTSDYALGTGLIDGLVYADQYETRIKGSTGTGEDEDQSYILLEDYLKIAKNRKIFRGDKKIAVIFAQGEMLYGEGGPNYIGQDVINEALTLARDEEDVSAIVLRVNSPGGSALTSELIWREIERTKMVKPVVVSMGDVTASAGYYIASGADRIFAEPTTITGSIGVFMIAPNIHDFANDIGINAEQVNTHTNSLEYSLFEPLTDGFRQVAAESIEDTYQRFLLRVSEGRDMSVTQADSLAQGRVWSGTDALRLGLVDEMGGLYEAIAEAATLAGVESYEIRKYPRYKSGFARLMEDLEDSGSSRHESLLRSELGSEIYGAYRDLQNALKQRGIQARMPFTIHIK